MGQQQHKFFASKASHQVGSTDTCLYDFRDGLEQLLSEGVVQQFIQPVGRPVCGADRLPPLSSPTPCNLMNWRP